MSGAAFTAGAYIEVTGGPWPERVGLLGVVVRDPGDGIYPFDKPRRGEVIVLLDHDPHTRPGEWWSCAIGTKDVRLAGRQVDEQ